MTIPSLRSTGPIVTYVSQSNFVSYPATSAARSRTVEAVVLRALADDRVDHPDESPLVALTRTSLYGDQGPIHTSNSQTLALKLDVGNKLEELGEVLFPPKTSIPTPSLLRARALVLDETYLHALLATWESKTDLDKLLITANAMPTEQTLTFTVNFSKKRQRSLGGDLNVAFKKMRNELGDIAALGPTLATLERDGGDRLHLHGMVMTDVPSATLKKLLLKLGGVAENVRFRNTRQVKISPATCPLGWGLYMTKDLLTVPTSTSDALIYASQEARRLGKAHLEDLRAASARKLGIKPEFRGRARWRREGSGTSRRAVRRPRLGAGVGHKASLCNAMPRFR